MPRSKQHDQGWWQEVYSVKGWSDWGGMDTSRDIHDALMYSRGHSGLEDATKRKDKMINEKLEVSVIDNHYHIKIGCAETIIHDKKEALKWLGKLWDEHIKEE